MTHTRTHFYLNSKYKMFMWIYVELCFLCFHKIISECFGTMTLRPWPVGSDGALFLIKQTQCQFLSLDSPPLS